ncbi:MAG: hypothetical protein ACYTG0_12540 [Planctomycetota bacterium]|jgi:hypothetical protein
MPKISHHGLPYDWCHICGIRSDHTADVWYPDNAEHDDHNQHPNDMNYIRICASCAERVAHAARGLVFTEPRLLDAIHSCLDESELSGESATAGILAVAKKLGLNVAT